MQLINGECLEVMRNLPSESIDAIITDPPYFRVKGEAWDRQWDDADHFIAWIGQLCEQWHRLLKPNGSLYVWASPKMAARVEVEISRRFNVLNRIRWVKTAGWHQKTKKEELRSYLSPWEECIFAEHFGADSMAKGEALGDFLFEPLRSYLADAIRSAGWTPGRLNEAMGFAPRGMAEVRYFGRSQWQLPTAIHYERMQEIVGREFLRREYEDLRREYEDLRRPFAVTADVPWHDVWDFPTVKAYAGKHPCEKPVAMLQHIIRSSTRPNAVVLDCFMGSGSTGEACEREGRQFIGIELDQKYFAQAEQRLSQAQRVLELG